MKIENSFQIELNGVVMSILHLKMDTYYVYQVDFSSSRKQLVVTKSRRDHGKEFWTSIPEGRQKEAEGVGKLIDDYNKKKEN